MKLFNSKRKTQSRKNKRSSYSPSFLRFNTSGKKRREIRMRSVKALLVIIGLAAAAVALKAATQLTTRSLLSENDLFQIKEYKINSRGNAIKPERVIDWASLNSYSNMFALDIRAVRKNLIATVPRIKALEISRHLNGVISIDIWERTEIARLEMEGFYLTIDEEGCVLGHPSDARDLPIISGHHLPGLRPGIFLNETSVMNAIETIDVCETTAIGKIITIKTIDVSNSDLVLLRLADDTVVKLAWQEMGSRTDAAKKNLKNKMVILADSIRDATKRGERVVEIDISGERNFPAKYVRK